MRIKPVEIEFGGKTRKLIYDYNALAELQDEAGTYKSDVASMKALRATVWAGLLSETLDSRGRQTPRTLSIVEVGDTIAQMSEAEVSALADAVIEARAAAEPPKEERPTTATETPTA